jgi:hypothetical protein
MTTTPPPPPSSSSLAPQVRDYSADRAALSSVPPPPKLQVPAFCRPATGYYFACLTFGQRVPVPCEYSTTTGDVRVHLHRPPAVGSSGPKIRELRAHEKPFSWVLPGTFLEQALKSELRPSRPPRTPPPPPSSHPLRTQGLTETCDTDDAKISVPPGSRRETGEAEDLGEQVRGASARPRRAKRACARQAGAKEDAEDVAAAAATATAPTCLSR